MHIQRLPADLAMLVLEIFLREHRQRHPRTIPGSRHTSKENTVNDNPSRWSITGDLSGLSSPFGHDVKFSLLAKLLAENPEALKRFLENLATATAQKVGNNHPLVIGLETMIGTHFPPPIPAEPVDRTVNDNIDPLDNLHGSNGPWPDADDR